MIKFVFQLRFTFVALFFGIFELDAQNITLEKRLNQRVTMGVVAASNYGTGILTDYSLKIYNDIFAKVGIDYFFDHKGKSYFGIYIQPEYNLTRTFRLPSKWELFTGGKLDYFFAEGTPVKERFLLDIKLRVHYFVGSRKSIFVEIGKSSSMGIVVMLD